MDDGRSAARSTRQATYWSRSRGEYWVKGQTSGHTQHVREVRLDCDGDTILLKVDQVGPACHTNKPTCFDAGRRCSPTTRPGCLMPTIVPDAEGFRAAADAARGSSPYTHVSRPTA